MTRTWIRSMVLAAGVGSLTAVSPAHAAEPSSPTPAEALARLKDGNARFVAGTSEAVPMDAPRRNELLASQHPFAIVLSCADSRVPPELVFNVGLGDLFVIRTAGEVADRAVLASVEYRSSTCTRRCCSSWGTSRAAPCRRHLNRTRDPSVPTSITWCTRSSPRSLAPPPCPQTRA